MNPAANSNEPILSRFLRLLYQSQERQAEKARHRNDHEKRGGSERRKKARQAAQASKRRNRR